MSRLLQDMIRVTSSVFALSNLLLLLMLLLLLLLLHRAARQQLDPDCFQLSSTGRTATRDFRNGVTHRETERKRGGGCGGEKERVRRAFFSPSFNK